MADVLYNQFFGSKPEVWVSGASYAAGSIVFSPGNRYKPYIKATLAAGNTTDPKDNLTDWEPWPSGGGGAASVIKMKINASITFTSGLSTSFTTMSAVVPAKTIIIPSGGFAAIAVSGAAFYVQPFFELNALGNRIDGYLPGSAAGDQVIKMQVIEFT